MGDVFFYRVPLPGGVRGATILRNGDYIVLINENLREETQIKAVEHELRHIAKEHFFNERPAVENEREAAGDFESAAC